MISDKQRFLEIKHLRMLLTIARTKNLTAAASHLHISQPALSQQLKDIEYKMGTLLFTRTGKNMILTRIGKNLLPHAKSVIQIMEQAEIEIRQAVYGEQGELKIGVRCLFCYQWFPKVIKTFKNRFPNIDLSISNATDPVKDLRSEAFDIIISSADISHADIATSDLFSDELLCVLSENHPLSTRKSLELEEFQGVDMIAMVEKKGPSFYNFFFAGQGIKLGKYMTVTHPEAVVDLVEANLGIALLPRWFILPLARTRKIVCCRLTRKKTFVTWNAAFLKRKDTPLYQKELLQLIQGFPVAQSHSGPA